MTMNLVVLHSCKKASSNKKLNLKKLISRFICADKIFKKSAEIFLV